MISVAFTFSPAGGATDLEVEGRAFDGWASARYDDAPSEISEGGPHLVVELPVERFTPDGRGLVLWIGDDCFRVDLGTRRAPAGGTVTGRMAVLAEGGAADRKDILFLEKLPVFNADGSVK